MATTHATRSLVQMSHIDGPSPHSPPSEARESSREPTGDPTLATASWSTFERVAFRYLVCHWLLYAFPSPLSGFVGFVRGLFLKVVGGDDLPGALEQGFTHFSEALATPREWWQSLTTQLGDMGWTFGIEVIHQPTGAGDTGANFVRLGCIVVFSVVLTILWSLVDRRRRAYPVLGRWVHLGARWYVALHVFGYGLAKFYGGQFAEPTISALTREVGDHSPMGLVWTFMGASQPYNYFSGVGEVACFALLLHRRTTLMGCFVTLGVMGNVCAINWLYKWPVKLYSTHLLLTALFLMAPYRHRLWALFISNTPSTPVDLRVVGSRRLGWVLLIIGMTWAGWTAYSGIEGRSERWNKRLETSFRKPELYGLWKVERMLLDGKQVSPTNALRWKHLIIDRGGYCTAKTLLGQAYSFTSEEDLEAGTISLAPRGDGDSIVWTIERSTITRKVRHPAPKRRSERGARIDGEVQAIVFRGPWKGQELELHTVQKTFRIHDGFRLIREFPR